MPQWVFHHTEGAFSFEDKEKITQGMSSIYTNIGLPAFLAHVHFIELPPGDIWTGGKPSKSFTTISIYHAAANIRGTPDGEKFLKKLDDVLRPVLKPKGVKWESNVYETPRDLWRLQGMAPPDFNSDMLKKWVKDNAFTDEDEEKILRQQGYLVCKRPQITTDTELTDNKDKSG